MSWYWWLVIAAGIVAVLFYLLVLPGPAEPDYRGDQLGSPAGEPEECVWCHRPALGYARLADGGRVCHSDVRSCYNDATYRLGPDVARDEWDDLDADTQAEQLISEWHAGEEHERTALVEDHVTAWLDDPDLIVWDAKQQAARCWEILHIEFPRLRAELGIAA